MDVQHSHAMDIRAPTKRAVSDDDSFGGSTTEGTTQAGDFTEMSGGEDGSAPHAVPLMQNLAGGMTMPAMAMPAMAVPAMAVPAMAMPATAVPAMATPAMAMPAMAMPAMAMPTMSMTMPMQAVAPQGVHMSQPSQQMMYCLTVAPDGTQMLMPVSQMSSGNVAHMPAWGMQMQQVTPQLQENPVPSFMPPAAVDRSSSVGSLEAKAAALTVYAAEVKAQARKAKAAAAVAARRRVPSEAATSERTSSDLTPRWADVADQEFPLSADDADIPNDDRTTLMFRNLPNNYNRSTLLQMLDSEGFRGSYDLIYLPTDFRNFAGFGYAFVNFVMHEDAKRAKASFQGYARWRVPSRKTCDVVWSGPVQGLQAHTERYRNSPVMHESVPDEYKPAVFAEGVRVSFPAPTKRIRPPRVRRSSAGDGVGIAAPLQDHTAHAKRSGREQLP